jgi:uncharacterized membrane protein HdeD (DUF308 family)
MHTQDTHRSPVQASNTWLKSYYFVRFAVSAAWVFLAFTLAKHMPSLAAIMLVAYPAWDALANFVDAQNTGGLGRNKSQFLNVVISVLTGFAVGIALAYSMNAVLAVYGVWAFLSGLLQLTTAVRRWKTNGAQWAMILSGAQSALAGAFFVNMASGVEVIDITNVAPYAAFGAFYFLVSAVLLTVGDLLRKSPQIAK